jgi:serine/threonine protein kinase
MKVQEGQRKLYGNEEALYFQIENNEHWVKRYLNRGRYEIFGLLAVGGFGCIFGAYDRWNYDNQVVIKTPFYMGDYCRPYIARSKDVFEKQVKSLNKLYEREKRYLCGFSNAGFDSIVNLNDYFTDRSLDLCTPFRNAAGVQYVVSEKLRENAPYIVMKYIQGESLRDMIAKRPLEQIPTLRLAKQILVLMRYLHQPRKTKTGRPFYYLLCDLKAENIIVCDDEVILIDFGAVKIYWMDQREIEVPIFVTDGYAATEVYSGSLEFRDNPQIDNRFDIFTVGALMVHCLTGKHPQQFLVDHSPPQHNFNLDEYRYISDSIKSILHKATARNRENRYADVNTMLKHIWKALERI